MTSLAAYSFGLAAGSVLTGGLFVGNRVPWAAVVFWLVASAAFLIASRSSGPRRNGAA